MKRYEFLFPCLFAIQLFIMISSYMMFGKVVEATFNHLDQCPESVLFAEDPQGALDKCFQRLYDTYVPDITPLVLLLNGVITILGGVGSYLSRERITRLLKQNRFYLWTFRLFLLCLVGTVLLFVINYWTIPVMIRYVL